MSERDPITMLANERARLWAELEDANARIARLVEEKNEWIKNEAALVAALDDAEARIAAAVKSMNRFIDSRDSAADCEEVACWRDDLLDKGVG